MRRERFSHKTALKWDHGLDPDIPTGVEQIPKISVGEVIPTIPWIQGRDGPKSCWNREYPRKNAHSGVGMRYPFIPLPHISQGVFPWIPALENRGITTKPGMVEDREQGGI